MQDENCLGADCKIGSFCFIEYGAKVGPRCTIKNGVYVWHGVTLESDVFVGPGVAFTNDKHPRTGKTGFIPDKTLVKQGAVIGANATILPGVTIGERAVIGAGAVVTRDVGDGEVWTSPFPAEFRRNITELDNLG